jgi:hypothetical protein
VLGDRRAVHLDGRPDGWRAVDDGESVAAVRRAASTLTSARSRARQPWRLLGLAWLLMVSCPAGRVGGRWPALRAWPAALRGDPEGDPVQEALEPECEAFVAGEVHASGEGDG